MNLKDRLIIEAFRKERNDFVMLGDVVDKLLHDIVKKLGSDVFSIEHRVKQEKSLEGKLYLKGEKYKTLDDLTDILGARIICFFNDDVNKVGDLIEEYFVVDYENSIDKRTVLSVDSFGYLSLHYICSLPKNSGYDEKLLNKKFEIQVRTGLQHVWASINHDIGYKSEFGVPKTIKREFSRLAGMLELADDEFIRVRDDMKKYSLDIREKIINNNAQNVGIDLVSLREYMQNNKKMQSFLQRLAAIEGSEIMQIDPQNYIKQLEFLGKTTIGDIQNMLEKNEELAFAMAKKVLSGSELDILSSNVALRYLCRAELVSENYPIEKAVDFISISLKDKSRAESQAKRLFNIEKKADFYE